MECWFSVSFKSYFLKAYYIKDNCHGGTVKLYHAIILAILLTIIPMKIL